MAYSSLLTGVRDESMPTGQARGTGLGARGKSRVSDRKTSHLASRHLSLARKLVIAAEMLMNLAGYGAAGFSNLVRNLSSCCQLRPNS